MVYFQFIISLVVLIWITVKQLKVYFSTIKELNAYVNIFPGLSIGDSFKVIRDENTSNIIGIETTHNSVIINKIVSSINNYLINNQSSVSDYHILKDIVDRNCDSKEEEVNTQIPVPIFYGLMGTMLGIILGVIFLMISGGINQIMGIESTNSILNWLIKIGISGAVDGASGIDGLLMGVAVAMLSSINGIILNVRATRKLKNNKAIVDSSKNDFLSWIQVELLPNLSNDTTLVFEKVTRNLMDFNTTFSKNTQELKETLSIVSQNTESQVKLIKKLNNLNIYEIASSNIQVYDKLKNSTKEIGQFATYLENVNGYISGINDLNQKLDEHDARTQAIEDMGFYFREERSKMERWNGVVSKSVAKVNEKLSDSVEALSKNTDEQISHLKESTIKQNAGYSELLEEQQEILEKVFKEIREGLRATVEEGQKAIKKVTEEEENILKDRKELLDSVLEEIKSVSSIKSILSDFTKATKEQNKILEELLNSVSAVQNIEGGPIIRQTPQKVIIPQWFKITSIAVVAILVLPNLINLIIMLISVI